MKEIPMLFSTAMVQAILDGRKTMTRRVIKQTNHVYLSLENGVIPSYFNDYEHGFCPYGQVGDMIWVKESYYAYGRWVKKGTKKVVRLKRYPTPKELKLY